MLRKRKNVNKMAEKNFFEKMRNTPRDIGLGHVSAKFQSISSNGVRINDFHGRTTTDDGRTRTTDAL